MTIAIIPNDNGTVDLQVASVNSVSIAANGGVSGITFSDASIQTTAGATPAAINTEIVNSFTGTQKPPTGAGYTVMPNGVILQYGTIPASGATQSSATFPIAFPNRLIGLADSSVGNTGYTIGYLSVRPDGNTGCTAYAINGGSVGLTYYVAMGY
jgi:hypothetical protein